MEIKTYNRSQLSDFINSAEFDTMPVVPISKQRAISQINNPRAADEDVLLAVCYEKRVMAGYLGVLPDNIFNGDKSVKVGWLSCFWVDERYSSRPVAAGLFLEILDAWDRNILITNFVPSLLPLYRKTGLFSKEKTMHGIRAYLRMNLGEILPPKNTLFRSIRPLLTFADSVFNLAADIRFKFFREYPMHDIKWKELTELDDTAADFIRNRNNRDNWTRRHALEITWILRNPWILEKSPDKESKKYYFSSVSNRFFYKIITVKDSKGMTGFALICIRNRTMSVPYVFSENYDTIAGILVNYMVGLKCDMITVFHTELARAMKKISFPFLFKKEILKYYLISKSLEFIDGLKFQDGDGDCAFY